MLSKIQTKSLFSKIQGSTTLSKHIPTNFNKLLFANYQPNNFTNTSNKQFIHHIHTKPLHNKFNTHQTIFTNKQANILFKTININNNHNDRHSNPVGGTTQREGKFFCNIAEPTTNTSPQLPLIQNVTDKTKTDMDTDTLSKEGVIMYKTLGTISGYIHLCVVHNILCEYNNNNSDMFMDFLINGLLPVLSASIALIITMGIITNAGSLYEKKCGRKFYVKGIAGTLLAALALIILVALWNKYKNGIDIDTIFINCEPLRKLIRS